MNNTTRIKSTLWALLALAGIAYPGDYSTWSSYRQVTVNTTGMGLSGNVTNIPIPLRFNATAHADMLNNGATQILAGGADIRVTLADGTTDVPFEIETATTGATGSLLIWVKAGSVAQNSATAATFRVYWGKAGTTTMSNAKAVFDSTQGYQAVFHFNETGEAGTAFTDAVRGLTTTTGGTANNTVAPLFGSNSRTFGTATGNVDNISNQAIYSYFNPAVGHPLRTHTGPITISAWTRSSLTSTGNRAAGDKHIVYHGNGNTGAGHIFLKRYGVAGSATGADAAAGGNRIVAGGDTVATDGGPYVGFAEGGATIDHWIFVTAVWDGTNWTTHKIKRWDDFAVTAIGARATPTSGPSYMTVDSAKATTKPGNGAPTGTAGKSWFLGGWQGDGVGTADNAPRRIWQGQLDEVRIENVARSADYLRVRFYTERDTVNGASAVTVGATQVPAASSYAAWSGHRDIILNTSATGANVATDVLNFPVLVRLGSQESAIIAAANGGNSIRFSKADDVTPLPYEIEHWSSTAAAIWVKVDSVKGNNATQKIRMHWGNGSAASESNGAAVFDTANGFVAAWHLGNATGTNPRPSAIPDAPSAIVRNVTGAYQPIPGIIGMADSLPGGAGLDTVGLFGVVRGSRPYIDMRGPYSGYNDLTAGASYSIWVNPNTVPGVNGFARFLQMTSTDSVNNPTPANSRLAFLRHSGNGGSLAVRNGQEGGGNTPAIAMPAGAWMHLAFSKTGSGNTKIYVNGDSVHTYTADNSALVNTDRTNTWIGRSWDPANEYLNAKVDNVVLSKVGRTSAWFKLAYQNQKADNALTDIGLPLLAPGAPTAVTATGGNAQATVSWTAPVSNGGSVITGYKAMAVADTTKACTTTGALTCAVTGLTNGVAYTFVVKATNSVGTSSASAASNSVTPSALAGWSNGRRITLNTSGTGANVPGPVYNFPVLIRLGSAESAIISAANNGASIRFLKADSATIIPHQIESWTSTAAAIWVKVDTILGNNATQSIFMIWGNPSATSTSNGAAVFDTANGFQAVFHMAEATGDTIRDATANGFKGVPVGTVNPSNVLPAGGSLAGNAKNFNSPNDSITVGGGYRLVTAAGGPTNNSFDYRGSIGDTATFTVSAWVNVNAMPATNAFRRGIVTKADTGNGTVNNNLQWHLRTINDGSGSFSFLRTSVAPGPFAVARPNAVGNWTFVSYSSSDSLNTLRVYNELAAMGAATPANQNGVHTEANVFIGAFAGAGGQGTQFFNGLIDEVRLSKVARDTNWINLSYESQRPHQFFTNIGTLAASVPGAPTAVTATPSTTTTGSIVVAWTAPASTGGAAITAYTVTGTPGGACATTGALTCTVAGLTPGTSYTFTVRATNRRPGAGIGGLCGGGGPDLTPAWRFLCHPHGRQRQPLHVPHAGQRGGRHRETDHDDLRRARQEDLDEDHQPCGEQTA
jgi:hypothetical protein